MALAPKRTHRHFRLIIGKTAYHFGEKCKISGLKVGENVTVTYKVSGKIDWIIKIVVAKA